MSLEHPGEVLDPVLRAGEPVFGFVVTVESRWTAEEGVGIDVLVRMQADEIEDAAGPDETGNGSHPERTDAKIPQLSGDHQQVPRGQHG